MTTLKQIVIPKEEAVFRMDANGNWHNEYGRFEHPKVIRYFNTSIRKDENGYYVYQSTEEYEEKVYFPYEDTALFVVDIIVDADLLFVLNTAEKISPDPDKDRLFIKQDSLYLETAEHLIKFSSHAMVRFSKFIKEKQDTLFANFNEKIWPIAQDVVVN
jgi:hypothetical protein